MTEGVLAVARSLAGGLGGGLGGGPRGSRRQCCLKGLNDTVGGVQGAWRASWELDAAAAATAPPLAAWRLPACWLADVRRYGLHWVAKIGV